MDNDDNYEPEDLEAAMKDLDELEAARKMQDIPPYLATPHDARWKAWHLHTADNLNEFFGGIFSFRFDEDEDGHQHE